MVLDASIFVQVPTFHKLGRRPRDWDKRGLSLYPHRGYRDSPLLRESMEMGRFQRPRWLAPTLTVMSTGWAAAIGTAPAVAHGSQVSALLAGLTYLIGSVLCHQRPERSFHLAGAQLPVCARCTGLYVGGAIGVVAWVMWRRHRSETTARVDAKSAMRLMLIAAAPTAFTVATAVVGIWDLSNAGRAALALPLGMVAGALLAAVASNDLS